MRKMDGAIKLEMLITALRYGEFEKGHDRYSYKNCTGCARKFTNEQEVFYSYPSAFKLKGKDIRFDVTLDYDEMCLPCFIEMADALPESTKKDMADTLKFAKDRYERDKPTIYVPQAIADEDKEKKEL